MTENLNAPNWIGHKVLIKHTAFKGKQKYQLLMGKCGISGCGTTIQKYASFKS